MSPSPPPDLRVLCRKLNSIPSSQLPHALPSLINHILRCKDVLSAPPAARARDDASQVSVLTHQLKTRIGTLLSSRSRDERFAAIGLAKAAVDVGGWGVLRGAGPWVNSLLSIVEKGDPFASKELAIVALAKIYALVHPYQTLAREIATQTIPTFAKTCIQLIKIPASGQPPSTPRQLIETVCDAFSTLIPLYPATFRTFSSQIKTATRSYVAPTVDDNVAVPASLRCAARRLNISLHFVAAKSNGSEEWAKLVSTVSAELHSTADQVFRAVNESWEPANSNPRSQVELDEEPRGGGDGADQLPRWTGVLAGVERLVGLFDYLADTLRYPTKAAVQIPITTYMDAVSRVCLIARLSPKLQTWDQALDTNAAIGRDEKDELWSCMPGIHVAALQLQLTMFQRLGPAIVSLLPEVLDHLVRVSKSGMGFASVRNAAYQLLSAVLPIGGPTLSKPAVDILEALVVGCCRDLQEDAGYLAPAAKSAAPGSGDSKKNGAVTNADLFLQPQAGASAETSHLDVAHRTAAADLLTTMLSFLPQQHLKPNLRGLLDKTAILTRSRDAMLSSVLNPFKDQRGRVYPSILPHLSRQYPHDQGLEILRSNLRTGGPIGTSEMFASVDDMLDEAEAEVDDEGNKAHNEAADNNKAALLAAKPSEPDAAPVASLIEADLPIQNNPFEPKATRSAATSVFEASVAAPAASDSPPKRKHEGSDPIQPKRQELERPVADEEGTGMGQSQEGNNGVDDDDEGDDSDVSVHLNMELDDDEDEDEDDS